MMSLPRNHAFYIQPNRLEYGCSPLPYYTVSETNQLVRGARSSLNYWASSLLVSWGCRIGTRVSERQVRPQATGLPSSIFCHRQAQDIRETFVIADLRSPDPSHSITCSFRSFLLRPRKLNLDWQERRRC
jgi:hypothetical protein